MDDALFSEPIVSLHSAHVRNSFDCGVESLNRYLLTQATQDQRRNIAACFVLPDPAKKRIAGYYTLSAFSVVADALPDVLQKKLPKYGQVPCTLLGRLAVDRDYRSLGLGKHLLIDALRRALIHSSDVASWAVIVDAIDASAEVYYLRHGFIAFPNAPRRLFLPMATISKLFDP
jgi:GNAT superfamily N-acetyltransferase